MTHKKRLLVITIVYWVLLLYIISALVFWYIALEKQNTEMVAHKLDDLKLDDPAYEKQYNAIISRKARNTTQYTGEGVTFLAFILLGAFFMYRAVRRQFSLQRQQENFMMAITHELKTPIAIAKLNLETLQKHQLDEIKRQKVIDMTLQETNRLNNLVTNILMSAQLESGRKNEKEELNFSDLVRTSANEFSNRFHDHHWQIEIENDIELTGDSLLLQIFVNNLLENAVKYSPPGTEVACMLFSENNFAVLKIMDEGAGIPHAERNRVFEKFYRIGSEEIRSTKGTGLGLYLCKKIADDHRATIKIEDNTGKGTIFTTKFHKLLSR